MGGAEPRTGRLTPCAGWLTTLPLAARLAAAGRQTMQQQPSLADTGRLIRQLLLGGE